MFFGTTLTKNRYLPRISPASASAREMYVPGVVGQSNGNTIPPRRRRTPRARNGQASTVDSNLADACNSNESDAVIQKKRTA